MGIQVKPAVAIVGAGWAGLTAAVRLANAGASVTVFESAKQAGGRARSVEWQGIKIDNGQHLLVGAYAATLEIMQTVGVDIAHVLRRMPLTINVPGRFHLCLPELPAPLHLAFGLMRAEGPSLREKLSAALFMQRLKAARFRLPEESSVALWLDKNKQHGMLRDHLWNSLCIAALNTPPEIASAQVFANVMRDTLGGSRRATDMLLPAADLGQLFPNVALESLASAGVEVKLATRVMAIQSTNQAMKTAADTAPSRGTHRWQIVTSDKVENFDHVVVATAPQHAASLLPSVPSLETIKSSISALEWEPIATAYLQYPAHVQLPYPLIALNHGAAQWLADRGQLGGPSGLLAHVLSAHGDWEKLGNDELVASLHESTLSVLKQMPSMSSLSVPENTLVIREHRATFRCRPNLHRPGSETPLKGLWLAGDYVASDYPGTIEAAVRSGNAVAAAILATTSAASRPADLRV